MLPTKSRTASRIEKGQTISMPTSLSAKFSLALFLVGGRRVGKKSERKGWVKEAAIKMKQKTEAMVPVWKTAK